MYVPCRRKELEFFDRHYQRGFDSYGKFFPRGRASGQYVAVGEITPYYFFGPNCPERIARAGIQKLILMLRNPVDRAWSYYGQKVRNGMFSGTFDEFLTRGRWPVVEQGYYSRYLETYLRHFDPAQILVLVSEDVFVDVSAAQRRLADSSAFLRRG